VRYNFDFKTSNCSWFYVLNWLISSYLFIFLNFCQFFFENPKNVAVQPVCIFMTFCQFEINASLIWIQFIASTKKMEEFNLILICKFFCLHFWTYYSPIIYAVMIKFFRQCVLQYQLNCSKSKVCGTRQRGNPWNIEFHIPHLSEHHLPRIHILLSFSTWWPVFDLLGNYLVRP